MANAPCKVFRVVTCVCLEDELTYMFPIVPGMWKQRISQISAWIGQSLGGWRM